MKRMHSLFYVFLIYSLFLLFFYISILKIFSSFNFHDNTVLWFSWYFQSYSHFFMMNRLHFLKVKILLFLKIPSLVLLPLYIYLLDILINSQDFYCYLHINHSQIFIHRPYCSLKFQTYVAHLHWTSPFSFKYPTSIINLKSLKSSSLYFFTKLLFQCYLSLWIAP